MEPASSQPSQRLTPELQAVIGGDWVIDSVLPPDWYARYLAEQVWDRFIRDLYRGPLPASATGVDMSLAIGTVGTIDPTSICDDPACDQRGELMKDHRVIHRNKGKKGTRGTCQHCGGNLHNTNDAAQLIAFQCLWRQAFGKDSKKTEVNTHNLTTLVNKMGGSHPTITGWADKTFLASLLTAPKAPPAVVPAGHTAPTGSAPAAAPTLPASPAAPSPAATSALATPARTTPTTTSSAPIVDPAVTEEKRRKLREALKGARVQP